MLDPSLQIQAQLCVDCFVPNWWYINLEGERQSYRSLLIVARIAAAHDCGTTDPTVSG